MVICPGDESSSSVSDDPLQSSAWSDLSDDPLQSSAWSNRFVTSLFFDLWSFFEVYAGIFSLY